MPIVDSLDDEKFSIVACDSYFNNELHLKNAKCIKGIFDSMFDMYDSNTIVNLLNDESSLLYEKYVKACNLLELKLPDDYCVNNKIYNFTSFSDASYLSSDIVDIYYLLLNNKCIDSSLINEYCQKITNLDMFHKLYDTNINFKLIINNNSHQFNPDDLYYIKTGSYLTKLLISNLHLIPYILNIQNYKYLEEIKLEICYQDEHNKWKKNDQAIKVINSIYPNYSKDKNYKIYNFNSDDLIISNCPKLKTIIFNVMDLNIVHIENCPDLINATFTAFNCNRVNFCNSDNLTFLKMRYVKIIHGVNLRTCSLWKLNDEYRMVRPDRKNPTLYYIFSFPDSYNCNDPLYKNTDFDYIYLTKIGYFYVGPDGKLKKNLNFIE